MLSPPEMGTAANCWTFLRPVHKPRDYKIKLELAMNVYCTLLERRHWLGYNREHTGDYGYLH